MPLLLGALLVGIPAFAQTVPIAMAPQFEQNAFFAVRVSDATNRLSLYRIQQLNGFFWGEAAVRPDNLNKDGQITSLAVDHHSASYIAVGTSKGIITVADLNRDADSSSSSGVTLKAELDFEVKDKTDKANDWRVTALAFPALSNQKIVAALWDPKAGTGVIRLFEQENGRLSYKRSAVADIRTGRVDAITFTGTSWSTYAFREYLGERWVFRHVDVKGAGDQVFAKPAGDPVIYTSKIAVSTDGQLFSAVVTDLSGRKPRIAFWNSDTCNFLKFYDLQSDPLALCFVDNTVGTKTNLSKYGFCLLDNTGSQPAVIPVLAQHNVPESTFNRILLEHYEKFLESDMDNKKAVDATNASILASQTSLEALRATFELPENAGPKAQESLDLLRTAHDLKSEIEETTATFNGAMNQMTELINTAESEGRNPADWHRLDDLNVALTTAGKRFEKSSPTTLWSRSKELSDRTAAIVEIARTLPSTGKLSNALPPPALRDGLSLESAMDPPDTDKRGPVRVVEASTDCVAAITGDQLRLWKLAKDGTPTKLHSVEALNVSPSDPEEFFGLTWLPDTRGDDASLYVAGHHGIVMKCKEREFGRNVQPSIAFQFPKQEITALAVPESGNTNLLLAGTIKSGDEKGQAQLVDVETGSSTPLDMQDSAEISAVTTADFSPDGKLVAVGDYLGKIGVFDVGAGSSDETVAPSNNSGQLARAYYTPSQVALDDKKPDILYCLRFLSTRDLIWCRADGAIYRGSIADGQARGASVQQSPPLFRDTRFKAFFCLALSEDKRGERYLAAGGNSNRIFIWRVRRGRDGAIELESLVGCETKSAKTVRSLAFVPGKQILVIGAQDGTVEIDNYKIGPAGSAK